MANDVVKETESSLKAFVTYFTITEEDVLERDEGAISSAILTEKNWNSSLQLEKLVKLLDL